MSLRPFLLALALLVGSTAAAASPFRFQVPAGWTDLSPTAPPENFTGLPPAFLQQLKAGGFEFVAIDRAGGADGFAENVNVVVKGGSPTINESFMSKVAAEYPASVQKESGGAMTVQVIEHGVANINGVVVGRLSARLVMGNNRMRNVVYLLPSKWKHAVVTYTAAEDAFPRYEAVFEEAAHATMGVKRGSPLALDWSSGMGRILIGALGGGVLGLILKLVNKSS